MPRRYFTQICRIMTVRCIYELTYTKSAEGWGYIITTPSGNNVSGGYPTKRQAKRASQEIVQMILKAHNGIEVIGRNHKKTDKGSTLNIYIG